MLQLRAIQITDVTERTPFRNYLGLRMVAMAAAMTAIVAITVVGYSIDIALAVIAFGLAKAIEAIGDIYLGRLWQRDQIRTVAMSQAVKGLSSLTAVAGALVVTGSVVWAGAAMAAAWGAVVILIDMRAVHALGGRPGLLRPAMEPRALLPLLWRTLPLGIALAMVTLNNAVPRLFLERSGALHELGAFSALTTLTIPATLVVGAVGQVMAPRLAHAYARNDKRQVVRAVTTMLVFALAVGGMSFAVTVSCRRWVLELLYSSEISAYSEHLPWMMFGGVLWCLTSVLGYTSVATGRVRAQPVATAGSLVLTLLGAWYLIPRFGFTGAAWSFVISAASMLAFYIWLMTSRSDRE
jgi:O-antigen/teichoic acid export membrane protein